MKHIGELRVLLEDGAWIIIPEEKISMGQSAADFVDGLHASDVQLHLYVQYSSGLRVFLGSMEREELMRADKMSVRKLIEYINVRLSPDEDEQNVIDKLHRIIEGCADTAKQI